MQSESLDSHDRLSELVQRSWKKLDWQTPLVPERLVITESHYMDVGSLGLAEAQRQKLNRLFACFTCELFIHFERYIIKYLEHRGDELRAIPAAAIDRLVAEEKAHSDAFQRLLCMLRPDLYPDTGTTAPALRFMRWSVSDDLAIALAPTGSFFLLAWLFEEITLFVPVALDQNPEQCAPIIAQVMRLHAKEEQPHVAIDSRVLLHNSRDQPRWKTGAETVLSLLLLAYAESRAHKGWEQAVARAESELGLTPGQRHRLLHRGPSQSDRLGTASFAAKIAKSPIPAAPFLAWILRQQLSRAS